MRSMLPYYIYVLHLWYVQCLLVVLISMCNAVEGQAVVCVCARERVRAHEGGVKSEAASFSYVHIGTKM